MYIPKGKLDPNIYYTNGGVCERLDRVGPKKPFVATETPPIARLFAAAALFLLYPIFNRPGNVLGYPGLNLTTYPHDCLG
jgi:hypothetical protein